MEDKISKIFDFLKIVEELKKTERWGTIRNMGRKESSADHSWSLAVFILVVAAELKIDVDILKSLKIALVHDLVEALAGDVDQVLIVTGRITKKQKIEAETKAMDEIYKTLPPESGKEIKQLWLEYEEGKTKEALLVKAMDKIESINHILNKGHGCFDYPELIAPYPNNAVNKFPELKPVLKELQKRLKPEYKKHGWEWTDEYCV